MRIEHNNIVNEFIDIIHNIWDKEYQFMRHKYPEILNNPAVKQVMFLVVNGASESPHPGDSDITLLQNELTTSSRHLISNDADLVVEVDICVLIHRYHILRILSDCNWNIDIASEHIRLSIRHELGHVTDHASYIGCTSSDIDAWRETIKNDYDHIGDVPTDLDAYWRWQLKYYDLSVERKANELAGITLEDIAIDIYI